MFILFQLKIFVAFCCNLEWCNGRFHVQLNQCSQFLFCAFCNPRHKDLRFHVVFLATWAPELPACFSSVSPARLGSLVAWLLLWWDHLGIQNSLVPVYTKKVTWGLDIIGPPGWGQPFFAVTLQSSHVLLMLMPCHLPSRASKQRCLCDVFCPNIFELNHAYDSYDW